MSSSDKKDVYRLVPYRFMINESEADICKLEKLTNLFPEMKAIIELGILIEFLKNQRKSKINPHFFFSIKNYSKLIIYNV
jgi:hypothetical protein